MQKIQTELFDFLDKALVISRDCLRLVQEKKIDELVEMLDSRERVINIISYLHEKLMLHQTQQPDEAVNKLNAEIYTVIDRIHSLDDIILDCLNHEKTQTQVNLASTFKNKENFKGYNLKSLK